MRQIKLGTSGLTVPAMAVGCMRLQEISHKEAEHFFATALENGANFFDHAECYGDGECEKLFADAVHMSPSVREKMFIQSKCGLRDGYYDFSREYLTKAIDAILLRLRTDYLDVFLLHRPDALCDPEEVAEVFDRFKAAGKIRNFGVSNHNPGQIELLSKYLKMPIVANQMQLSITEMNMITNGINVNMTNDSAICRDGGVLDYCRLKDITIQPWSPFQFGFFGGTYMNNPDYKDINDALGKVGSAHGIDTTAAVMAWFMRHPAHFMPVTGTMNAERLISCIKGCNTDISREEWYEIYRGAGNMLP